MSPFSFNNKRKKRRTRKCLNEIRRRSHLLAGPSDSKIPVNFLKNNINCSNNRITLDIFPKTVRSETITRPLLTELKEKSCHVLMKDIKKTTLSFGTIQSSKVTIYSNTNDMSNKVGKNIINNSGAQSTQYTDEVDGHLDKEHGNYSNNLSSISPLSCLETIDVLFKKSKTKRAYIPPHGLFEGNGYNLYEEFMKEVPIFLNLNSKANKEDNVIEKTKEHLQNILKYIRNNELTKEMDISSESKHTEMQNSKDCIRLQYNTDFGREYTNELHMTDTPDSFSSQQSLHSPYSMINYSPKILITDTPEYNYYPHKLNDCEYHA